MKQTLRNIFFFFIPIAWDSNAKRVIKAMEKVRPLTQEEKNAIRSLVRAWKKEGIWQQIESFNDMSDPEFYHINWFDPENSPPNKAVLDKNGNLHVVVSAGVKDENGLYRAIGQCENRPS